MVDVLAGMFKYSVCAVAPNTGVPLECDSFLIADYKVFGCG